jgi:hypothetical protein
LKQRKFTIRDRTSVSVKRRLSWCCGRVIHGQSPAAGSALARAFFEATR